MENNTTPSQNPPREPAPSPGRPGFSNSPAAPQPPMPSRPQFTGAEPAKSKKKKSKAPLWVLLVVLLLAGTAAGVYFWQNNQVSELKTKNSNLENQVSSLKSQQTEGETETEAGPTTAVGTTQESLVTAQATQTAAGSDVRVACRGRVSDFKSVWIQYGDAPTVEKKTAPRSEGLGQATEGGLGDEAPVLIEVIIPAAEVTAGEPHYYQCAGETVEGETLYGGVATFDALK